MAIIDGQIEDELVDKICMIDPNSDYDKKIIRSLEEEYGCKISVDIRKHNPLQYTYYYEIIFGDDTLYLEIESGINNGTQLNSWEWNCSSKPETETVEILKDIVLDLDEYPNLNDRRLAQEILDNNKHILFDYHRRNNYDNYVTGGNSKLKPNKHIVFKLKVKYIYDEIENNIHYN